MLYSFVRYGKNSYREMTIHADNDKEAVTKADFMMNLWKDHGDVGMTVLQPIEDSYKTLSILKFISQNS